MLACGDSDEHFPRPVIRKIMQISSDRVLPQRGKANQRQCKLFCFHDPQKYWPEQPQHNGLGGHESCRWTSTTIRLRLIAPCHVMPCQPIHFTNFAISCPPPSSAMWRTHNILHTLASSRFNRDGRDGEQHNWRTGRLRERFGVAKSCQDTTWWPRSCLRWMFSPAAPMTASYC